MLLLDSYLVQVKRTIYMHTDMCIFCVIREVKGHTILHLVMEPMNQSMPFFRTSTRPSSEAGYYEHRTLSNLIACKIFQCINICGDDCA
jgi:hypothetical protein